MEFFDVFKSKPEPICPSCNQPIEVLSKRSGTCIHCKQKYYMRKDYETNTYVFVNTKGLRELKFKNLYFEWFNIYSHTFNKTGFEIVKEGLIRKRDEWFSKTGHITYGDFLWSLLNGQIFTYTKTQDWSNMSAAYQRLAIILHEVGKDNYGVLKEFHKWALKSFQAKEKSIKKEGYNVRTSVSIMYPYKDKSSLCENCQKVAGKEMLLDEAIELNLLPVKDCTCKAGYCNCVYFGIEETIE